jgi:cobalt-zinc-cadmium efflux system membrane fusion protein
MNHKFLPLVLIISIILFAGCSKPEAKPEEKPKVAKEKGAENIVTLKQENLEHIALKVEPVTTGSLGQILKAVGKVSANLNKTAKVTTTLEGRLVKLNYDLNQRVKVGDVLAVVETPELLGRPLEVKAPIDGVIVDRKATAGELVDKSKEIYTISDPTNLWVLAEVKERDIGVVKVGQDATFTVLPYAQEKFRGKVSLIGNQVEEQTRTLEVRINVDNADGRLKPGMFADIEITTTILDNVLLVEDDALQTDGESQVVFVALDKNRFEKRVVKLGEEQQGRVQVLEGLKAGEKVVTQGSFILKSEMLKGELGAE